MCFPTKAKEAMVTKLEGVALIDICANMPDTLKGIHYQIENEAHWQVAQVLLMAVITEQEIANPVALISSCPGDLAVVD